MSEKTVKIQLEDEVIEFKIEENQSLVFEIQNVNNELKINKRENVQASENNEDHSNINKSDYDLYDQDYIAKHHETSIYDVLNTNIVEESNVDEGNAIESENIITDDNKLKEVENNSENDSLVESVKAHQRDKDNNDSASYENMISNVLERFKRDEQKETNK